LEVHYPDPTPPDGSIITPDDNTEIGPTQIYFKADAWDETDGSGVRRVEFEVRYNGQWYHVKDEYYAPYEAYWTPPINLPDQDITVRINVEDNAGNINRSADSHTLHYQLLPDTIIVENPAISPAYGSGMCDSAWYRWVNNRGHYAYLTLNTNDPAQSTNLAEWAANLQAGTYKVEAFIATHSPINWQCPTKYIAWDTSDARYTIYHASGSTAVSADQAPVFNGWLNLGTYTFGGGGRKVRLVDLNGEPHLSRTVSFSAMRFMPQSEPPPADTTDPFGNIITPPHQSSTGPGTLYMRADAWDNISGSGVKRVEFWVKYDGTWHRIRDEYHAPYEANWEIPADLGSQTIEVALHVVDNAGNVAIDPGGKRTVYYSRNATTAVPYFSQRDPRWISHPLRGSCSSACSTIGACGCTLTSAAMVFNYHGANRTPASLSDCMGNYACPFYWYTGAACSNSAKFDRYYDTRSMSNATFWSLLESLVRDQPILLGMHRGYQTHWVVIFDGAGNSAGNYHIHDPWPINGADMRLSAYNSWYFDHIIVYQGTSHLRSEVDNTPELFVNDPQLLSAVNPTPITVDESVSLMNVAPFADDTVTGTVQIYRMTDISMTLQIEAESSAGRVIEMLVWTDNMEDAEWQPFTSYLELAASEYITVRFRDESGNVSSIVEETRYPTGMPLFQSFFDIYLPFICSQYSID